MKHPSGMLKTKQSEARVCVAPGSTNNSAKPVDNIIYMMLQTVRMVSVSR